MSVTGVVEELACQIRAQGIPHKRLLAKDERTLRVHQKRRGYVFNTDVELVAGDLYNLAVYQLDMRMTLPGGAPNPNYADVIATRTYEGAYWDQLPELVGRI